MSGDYIDEIRGAYSKFTKAEKKIADYIIGHEKEVLFMSITELAGACEVGETSVFRFCKTMQLQGYQEFKMKLSLGMRSTSAPDLTASSSPVNLEDSFSVLSQKLMQNSISAINETYSLLNPEEISRIMYYFERAEQVHFFGVGASMVTALLAFNKFLRITPKVQCVQDVHMQTMLASMLTEKDLAIVISYSGSTKDSIRIAKLAKESGAKVVCITKYEHSPLTNYSDAILLCGVNEGPLEGGSTLAQMSELYLIDILYMEYYKKKYASSSENNQKTSVAVLDKLY